MSFGTILLIAAGIAGGGTLLSRIFREGLEARDELGHLPFTSVGAAEAGPICVRGRARALGPPLVAPVSGRPALFFEIVTTYGSTMNSSNFGSFGTGEAATHRHIGATPFEVDDGSGRAVVNIPPDGPPVGEGEPEILTALPAFRRGAVVERIVAIDDVITVGGLAVWQVHSAGTRRGVRDAPTSLVFEARREQPLVLVLARYDAGPSGTRRA
jgi:hypothetical protein